MARPYVIVIASEKGGVGKTTLATNLAIYLKGLAEDLPVTLFSFDNHFTIDRMFQLTPPLNEHHVGHLFAGQAPEQLTRTGQYGVDYIPSCENLQDLGAQIENDTTALARILTASQLEGLLIIDTSPMLDMATRNALYAADRVIVPIKDAPSLENCRHLAEFMVSHQRSKTQLKILPCLIDTRIRFDGPFKNSYQLLKASAINRGYRCFEGYIAKSPKVESLSTNPSGKIYPVMTHARSTEVHLQFNNLARQVYLEYLEHGPSRINEVSKQMYAQGELHHHQFLKRYNALYQGCPECRQIRDHNRPTPFAWYFANSTGTFTGYVDEDCFLQGLRRDFYPEMRGEEMEPLFKELLLGDEERPYLLLRQTHSDVKSTQLQLYRLNRHGVILSERVIELKAPATAAKSLAALFSLAAETDPEPAQELILLHRAGEEAADLLRHDNYQRWKTVFANAFQFLMARPKRTTMAY